MKRHPFVFFRGSQVCTLPQNFVANTAYLVRACGQGFTVDGKSGSSSEIESYANKCVEVESMGKNSNETLEGFVMKDMVVKNCG